MPKRKAEEHDEEAAPSKKRSASKSPTKKGGFSSMDCPFSKSEFLDKAKDTTMVLELMPKKFGPGGYGYQKSGGVCKVEADGPDSSELGDKICYVQASCIANVLGSKQAQEAGKSLPTADAFLKKAKPFNVTFEISPVEFSTGSFGWMAHRKQQVTVDGKELTLQVNFNAPIRKSKEKGDEEEDPAVAGIDADSIKEHIPTIGVAEGKDDLTKIRGIGPWIEKRLNKIKIFTFKQISKMTPEIEEDVNEAIKFFKGRVRRDEWVMQARAIVGGKWDDLNPHAGNATGTVTIDGVKYENKLIEIAKHAMADGIIETFEAEALWFRAADGNKITAAEKKTLDYIMTSDSFKFDDAAKEYLEAKLAALDKRGVIPAS
eukprot:TRINITY_DN53533_c0_g1_i1.p1 TRINITY_DN53533_c0_g1~~TRINITY_DN53533_c0_g1_i1.p1  ORF type:complete len:374 (-),score=116.19 TRINITY_DN53533_c0_g1_i1:32-1153(-)